MLNGKLDKVYQLDDKINMIVQNKKDELETPMYAYVTFETQEGYERCLKYLGSETEKRE